MRFKLFTISAAFVSCLLFASLNHSALLANEKKIAVFCLQGQKTININENAYVFLAESKEDFDLTCGVLRYEGDPNSFMAAFFTAVQNSVPPKEFETFATEFDRLIEANADVFSGQRQEIQSLIPKVDSKIVRKVYFLIFEPFKYSALKRVISIADLSITQAIDSGSYGDCFLATVEKSKEVFVLKRFKKNEASSLEFCGAAHLLGCSYIADYLSVVMKEDNSEPAGLLMREAELGSLQSIIKDKKIMFDLNLLYGLFNVASGIANMHTIGFLHRDIKLANVLVFSDSTKRQKYVLKLSDFGISCHLKNPKRFCPDPQKPSETKDGIYFAPEMFLKEKPIRTATDWYCYGSLVEEAILRTASTSRLHLAIDVIGWLIPGFKTLSIDERYNWSDLNTHSQILSRYVLDTSVVSEIFYRQPIEKRHLKKQEIGIVVLKDQQLQFYAKMRRMPNGCFLHFAVATKNTAFDFVFVEHKESFTAIPPKTKVHFESLDSADYTFDRLKGCYSFKPETSTICYLKSPIKFYVSASFNFFEKKAYFQSQLIPISSNRRHEMHIYLKGNLSNILVNSWYNQTDAQCSEILENL